MTIFLFPVFSGCFKKGNGKGEKREDKSILEEPHKAPDEVPSEKTVSDESPAPSENKDAPHPFKDPKLTVLKTESGHDVELVLTPSTNELEALKKEMADTSKHLDWECLPEPNQFQRLRPSRKRLLDAIKMIAYRAETAMANIVKEKLAGKSED